MALSNYAHIMQLAYIDRTILMLYNHTLSYSEDAITVKAPYFLRLSFSLMRADLPERSRR